MKVIRAWVNGGDVVTILDDGTKIRNTLNRDIPPEWPETVDVKVTDKCNGGCVWCHENSTPDGKEMDLELAKKFFAETPIGVELAIGGGNPLESLDLLSFCCSFGMHHSFRPIFNVTLNGKHLGRREHISRWLSIFATALGISWSNHSQDRISRLLEENKDACWSKNAVIHCIAGVHSASEMARALEICPKLLILGYKTKGRGVKFAQYVADKLERAKTEIRELMASAMATGKGVAFDNLALEQLGIKELVTGDVWEDGYMGGDGTHSMYVDLVTMTYGVASTSPERYPIGDKTLKEAFAHVRELSAK